METNKQKFQAAWQRTYDETVGLLNKYGRAAIIRPTGFGKTKLLTSILQNYHNVIYLYPADIVCRTVLDFYYGRGTEETEIPGVTFMTYNKLVMLQEDEDYAEFKDVDLIISDESHRLGATETLSAMLRLIQHCPNAHQLGATATPERMDAIDEIAIFYDDHQAFRYTLHDAIQDGILQKPYYCFCAYGQSDDDVLQMLLQESMYDLEKFAKEDRQYAGKLIQSWFVEHANILKMDCTIKNTIQAAGVDSSYLRFIIFCSNIQHIDEAMPRVTEWFAQAYPTHTINSIAISSKNSESRNNLNQLAEMIEKEHTIDLIFCCDMINMGYHVESLTGIVMYRGTRSSIIYSQQLGRVLNAGADKPGIVIDVVDNLHRKSVYAVPGDKDKQTEENNDDIAAIQARYDELVMKTATKLDGVTPVKLTEDEIKELSILKRILLENSRDHSRTSTHAQGQILSDYGNTTDTRAHNQILADDLIAVGYAATYREFIAKTMAEAIAMRCRQAWARWLEKGGDDSIKTINYILGQQPPTGVPLIKFCKLKGVTIAQVLDVMGITEQGDTLSA